MHTRTAQRSFQFPVPQSCAYLQNQPARRLRARVCSQITRLIFLFCHGQSFTMRQRGKKRQERRENEREYLQEERVPQGANRSGFRIELGEVRDDAQEQTVVHLMMISLFDVHVIFLFFFLPGGEMQREKRICVSSVPSGSRLTPFTSASLPLPLSPSTPKHPGYLVPTVSDCQTLPLPLRGWPPLPSPSHPPPLTWCWLANRRAISATRAGVAVQVSSLLSGSGF